VTTAAPLSSPAPAGASTNEAKTASVDLGPVSSPAAGQTAPSLPATPAPAVSGASPSALVAASDDAPRAQAPASPSESSGSGSGRPVAAGAPKGQDTDITALSPNDVADADAAQPASQIDAPPPAQAKEHTPAVVAQLPDPGSPSAANSGAPRPEPTPEVAPPQAATADPPVANNPSPAAAPEAVGAPATSLSITDKGATSAQGEASPAAKPSPDAARAIELGKTRNGVGESSPPAKAGATAATATEGAVPATTPSAGKMIGAVLASKPILTRPAKPIALIATTHLPATHATKLAATPLESKPVDENGHAAGPVGAPLLITPPDTSEPMLEASAEPAETPQTADMRQATNAPETMVDGPAVSTSGPSFSLRLASSLSESDARATLSQLQKEFPGALQNGSVTRDNLGSYGVFYRVKVGPLPREAAERLCSRLRAAGKKCVLSRG